ncbi:GNAT family N-acetyltransferase [Kushneria sp. TE3]|uniref:GNAT family N-acetyltransferase n=1 Tax=Kushneria sp. TE3 TaxID=3449832 RepID=UPI003F688D1F
MSQDAPELAFHRHRDRALSPEAFLRFIEQVEKEFEPPLSEQHHLPDYADKLLRLAEIDYVLDGDKVVAAIACYANDHEHYQAYATFFGVLPDYRGSGIARPLLSKGIESCRQAGMHDLRARTWHRGKILAFYEDMGFVIDRVETNEWGVESLQLIMALGNRPDNAGSHHAP